MVSPVVTNVFTCNFDVVVRKPTQTLSENSDVHHRIYVNWEWQSSQGVKTPTEATPVYIMRGTATIIPTTILHRMKGT